MKKTLLTLLVLCMALGSAMAQKNDKKKKDNDKVKFLTYGIRTGLNMANIKSTAATGTTSSAKPLYHLGGYLRLNVGKKLSIQPEMDFSAEGMISALTDSATRLNYLDMPVNIVFRPVRFINLQAGPELGVLMSAVAKSSGASEKVTEQFNRGNVGFNVGIGITLLRFVNITGIYNYGLTDLSSANNVATADEAVKWLNRTFQLSVSYNFMGKKGKL